jgi:hypothetical protein
MQPSGLRRAAIALASTCACALRRAVVRLSKVGGSLEGGVPLSLRGAGIYHGRNHKEMKTFSNQDTRDEHWSTRSMTYTDLAELIGSLRAMQKIR